MFRVFILASFLISSFTSASTAFDLKCSGKEIYTDLGDASLSVSSNLSGSASEGYTLNGGTLKFSIGEGWTRQSARIGVVQNKKNYRPRNYSGHLKFEHIAPRFRGRVDLLLPEKSFQDGAKTTTAVFIFSNVEDHWGGTIAVDCTLK